MLYRASVLDVKEGRLSRRSGHLVIVMQYYPRFLRRDLVDEYVHALAPPRSLLAAFLKAKEKSPHNEAFRAVEYEKEFVIASEGEEELQRLTRLSMERDVFLLCQCRASECCHADLLLLMAREKLGAPISLIRHPYSIFCDRLKKPS